MTQEEFENLKVGDVFKNASANYWFINRIVEITSEGDYKIEVLDNYEGTNEGGDFIFRHGINCHDRLELLPLYNSPLYKAMSESEEK